MSIKIDDHPLIRDLNAIIDGDGSSALRVDTRDRVLRLLEDSKLLHEENERLQAIVNLIELKTERDEWKAKAEALQAKVDAWLQ